jgi:urea transport system permease protein
MDLYALQAFNALSVSSILLLIALGLAFSFGLMNVINMAHGELIMVGAYVTFLLQKVMVGVWGQAAIGPAFLLALPAAFIVAALIGLALERGLIRFLYGRPLDTLLVTWGIGLVLQQAARTIFGAPNVQVVSPTWLNGGFAIAEGVLLPYKRLFIIGLVLACLLAVYFYLYRSSNGRRIRAVMQNRSMAAALGVATWRVDAGGFALGSGLAGLAGCALTLIGPIGPAIGTYYIVDAFMVVVLGGVGQLIGTVGAALAIGILNSAFEFGSSATVGKVLVLIAIIAFLQWKPRGLVALRQRLA